MSNPCLNSMALRSHDGVYVNRWHPTKCNSRTASPLGWFIPRNVAENGGKPLNGPIQRLATVSAPRVKPILIGNMANVNTTSYVGVVLLGVGSSIWRRREQEVMKKAAAAGIICGVIAMGTALSIGSLSLPLPWRLAEWLPGLNQMKATSRFLTGLSVAAIIGLGSAKLTSKWWILIGLGLISDGLLLTPAHWPMPALKPTPQTPMVIEDDTCCFWPAAPVIASRCDQDALCLQRPWLFPEQGVKMPNADGVVHRQEGQRLDRYVVHPSNGQWVEIKWR